MHLKRLCRKSDMEHQKETLESDIRKYMDLRLEDLKLKAVDGLSVGVSRVLSMMVILMQPILEH